jgi:hypothetical protein
MTAGPSSETETRLDDAGLYAVMAHGLLSSVALIQGAGRAIDGDHVGPEKRERLVRIIREQADYLADVLRDIVRGLPPDVVRELNALARVPTVER